MSKNRWHGIESKGFHSCQMNAVNGGMNQLGIGTQCLFGMAPVWGGGRRELKGLNFNLTIRYYSGLFIIFLKF